MADFCWLVNYRWRSIAIFALMFHMVTADAQLKLDPVAAIRGVSSAQTDFDRLFAEMLYSEAADSAKLAIALLLQNPDYNRLEYAQGLTQLAQAQYGAEAFDAAKQNYLLAIEVIEGETDRLDRMLLAPLLGLSRSYVAAGKYADSVKSYKRTLHVHKVNTGLFGDEQAQIIAELSEAYYALGDFSQANAMQESYVNMVARTHAGGDLARLPSLYSQADMLSRTGESRLALNAYRRMISLIEKTEGPRSLELLPAFIAVSKLLVDQQIMDGDDGVEKAYRYLRRAIDLVENNDEADSRLRADTQITMGDFLSMQSPNRASMLRSYQHVWDELSKDAKNHNLRDDLFANPILLNSVPAGASATIVSLLKNAADPDTVKNGILTIHYDVDEFGRPDNIHVVQSIPPEYYDYVVTNHVRKFAFRPRFVDGEPIATPDLVFEIRFSYRIEDLPEEVRQNADKVAAEKATQ